MPPQANIILYSFIAGGATLLGIYLVILREKGAITYSHYVNSFAAGALVATALISLIPEAQEITDRALTFVLVAFILFYFLENFLVLHSGAEIHYQEAHAGPHHTKGLMVFSGLFFHSLIDGVVIGVGFEVSYALGILTALSVILHELPEGITSFAILRGSMRMDRRQALWLSIAVALATPFGAIIVLPITGVVSEGVLGALLALAAGSFLYIAAADLLPETHAKGIIPNMSSFLGGIGLLIALSTIL